MNLKNLDGPQIVAVIIGITEVFKKFGVASQYCLVLAIVVGVVFMELIQLAAFMPELAPWIAKGIEGLIYGLTATGLYMVGSRWANKIGSRWD